MSEREVVATENNKAVLHYPGGEFEMDIVKATEGNDGIAIGKLLAETGLTTFDPGYTATGSTTSAITYIDGGAGILRHRGYPIAAGPPGRRAGAHLRGAGLPGALHWASDEPRVRDHPPAPHRRRELAAHPSRTAACGDDLHDSRDR